MSKTNINEKTETAKVSGPPLFDVQWVDLEKSIMEKPKPLDFVIPGLKAGTVGALVSPGATGKTMLALQLAVTVAGGPDLLKMADWDHSWKRDCGKVVFLTGEDPSDILESRFYYINKHFSHNDLNHVVKNLSIAPLSGLGVDVMNIEWQRWIEKVTYGSRLVVIDTLRRFHKLEENDGGDMASVLGYMEKLCLINQTTVLFLHHSSKTGAMTSADSQQASRGSSVITDNARFQSNLIGMERKEGKKYGIQENERKNFVRLSFPKINYSGPITDQWFQRGEGGVFKCTNFSKNEKKETITEKNTKKSDSRRISNGF